MFEHIVSCPGCTNPLRETPVHNKLSRYGHGYICNNCGTKEAFDGDWIKDKDLTTIEA